MRNRMSIQERMRIVNKTKKDADVLKDRMDMSRLAQAFYDVMLEKYGTRSV